jgi:hypothetical protein
MNAGSVGFKDPWLIDFTDATYGNNLRNRGFDAPYIDRPSPFNLADEQWEDYKGVFLNENFSNNPLKPIYSLCMATTREYGNFTWNFIDWAKSNAIIFTPENIIGNNYVSNVVFTNTPSTVTAQYKAHLGSSSSLATGSNAQKKVVYLPNDNRYLMVYESAGTIWKTTSENGEEWTPEEQLSDLGTAIRYYRNPSVTVIGDYSVYVWEIVEEVDNVWYHTVELITEWNGIGRISFTLFDEAESFRASPVVAVGKMPDENYMLVVVWSRKNGLYYAYKYHDNTFVEVPTAIPGTGDGARNPSLASEIVYEISPQKEAEYGFYTHLVWEEQEQIYYSRARYSFGENEFQWSEREGLSNEYPDLRNSGNPVIILSPEKVNEPGTSNLHVFWHGETFKTIGELPQMKEPEWQYNVFYRDKYYQSGEEPWSHLTQFIHEGVTDHQEIYPSASLELRENGEQKVLRCVWQCGKHLTGIKKLLPDEHWEINYDFGRDNGADGIYPNIISNEATSLAVWTQDRGIGLYRLYTMNVGEEEKTNNQLSSNNFSSKDNSISIEHRRGSVNLSKVKFPGRKEHRLNGALWVESKSYLHNIGENQVAIPFSVERNPKNLKEWLGTQSFTVSANDILTGENAFILSDFAVNEIDSVRTTPFFLVELIDAQTKQTLLELDKLTLQQIANWNVSDSVVARPIAQSLNGLAGKEVKVRVRLVGQRELLREPAWTEIIYSEDSSQQRVLSKENGAGSLSDIPKEFSLEQNFPNPFNPVTQIKYQLPQDVFVTLKVFDILGKEVATLSNEMQTAGFKSVNFDAGKLSSGIYIYKLVAGSYISTKKLVVLK